MTGIEGIGWPPGAQRLAGRSRAGSGFVVPADATGGEAPATIAPTEGIALTAMLALQQVGGETVQDRAARRHSKDMLAALAELQRALLAGGDASDALQRLAALAAAVPYATDPRLMAIVSAIVMRVRVELARRQP